MSTLVPLILICVNLQVWNRFFNLCQNLFFWVKYDINVEIFRKGFEDLLVNEPILEFEENSENELLEKIWGYLSSNKTLVPRSIYYTWNTGHADIVEIKTLTISMNCSCSNLGPHFSIETSFSIRESHSTESSESTNRKCVLYDDLLKTCGTYWTNSIRIFVKSTPCLKYDIREHLRIAAATSL
jgi:hypothetical protein